MPRPFIGLPWPSSSTEREREGEMGGGRRRQGEVGRERRETKRKIRRGTRFILRPPSLPRTDRFVAFGLYCACVCVNLINLAITTSSSIIPCKRPRSFGKSYLPCFAIKRLTEQRFHATSFTSVARLMLRFWPRTACYAYRNGVAYLYDNRRSTKLGI